ncbi:hypothetical protein K466DRAFT_532227 [Polyporus arcularius HHB13444]|uniref:Uncharacterized protein n=1 Tax=Polyporus arcularius HHB13444 TaxID=1314778 RepID=A0A5C3NUS8_9APHY|nr:hypothetical protein K466DRAFT_532227 [Polyporus arcularius HHB13444]
MWMLPASRALVGTLFCVLGLANVVVDILLAGETRLGAALRKPPLSRYTFLDEDYPPYLPLPSARASVRLTFEESVHFSLTSPESTLEWAYTGAVGDSNIRLGHNHRFFNTGFSYQLHCARYIVGAFAQEDPPTDLRERAHVSRCLNVIRQFVMCSADTTLEPADAMTRNYTAARAGGERICRDWPGLYGAMEQNWVDWRAFQQSSEA